MLELDAQIRASLSLIKADTRRCLQLMDDLLAVNIDPLMLKKHPNIVETVKKVGLEFLTMAERNKQLNQSQFRRILH